MLRKRLKKKCVQNKFETNVFEIINSFDPIDAKSIETSQIWFKTI